MADDQILRSLAETSVPYTRRKGNSHVFARVTFGMTLFVHAPENPATADLIASALEAVRTSLPANAFAWWWHEGSHRPVAQANDEPISVAALVQRTRDAGEAVYFEMNDASDFENDAALFRIAVELETSPGPARGMPGTVHLTVPLSWLTEHAPDKWAMDTFLQLCRALRPRFGWAGFQLNVPFAAGAIQKNAPIVFDLLRRFPGIESASPGHIANVLGYFLDDLDGTMPSLGWLTAIDTPTLLRAGGVEAAKVALGSPEVPGFVYDGGLLIKAGPFPQTGDREKDVPLPQYRRVAKFLAPVRITRAEHVWNPVFAAAGDELDETALFAHQTEWLTRFD